jgi:hypothetical protein
MPWVPNPNYSSDSGTPEWVWSGADAAPAGSSPSRPQGSNALTPFQKWQQTAQWDEYGNLTNQQGVIPADIAKDVQAEHDRRVWAARNRLGEQASHYEEGALGLLQSYRPGGGASIESGVYRDLAATSLQRASMLQPVDMLGEWRAAEAARARKSAKRSSMFASGLQAVAAIGLAGFTGGASLAALPGALAGFGGSGQDGAQNAEGQTMQGPGWANPAGLQGDQGYQGTLGKPGGGPMAPPGVQGAGQGGPGGTGGPMAPPPMQAPPGGSQGGGGAMQATMGGGGGAAGGGGPQAGGGPQPRQSAGGGAGPDQPGAGAGMAGGGSVGSDGDFSPLAWARTAATRRHPIMDMHVSKYVASILEDDPSWQAIDIAIDRQIRLRMGAA